MTNENETGGALADDAVSINGPLTCKFIVTSPSPTVPPCALQAKPTEKFEDKWGDYTFFAMVDKVYSTVVFGKGHPIFHIAFKPEDWDIVQKEYPLGTTLELEMYPINQEVDEKLYLESEENVEDVEVDVEEETNNNQNQYETIDDDKPLVENKLEIKELKNLIDDIVQEMTLPLEKRLNSTKEMTEQIRDNLKNRYEDLPTLVENEIKEANRRFQGPEADLPPEHSEPGCRCIIN